MTLILLSCITATILVVFILRLLHPVAIRVGLVDIPGGRKKHLGPIPLIGGLGLFFGFSFTLLTLPVSLASYRSFMAASALLILLGLLDDFHELSRRSRLIGQVIAACIMAMWGHNIIYVLGDLFGSQNIFLGYFAIPFTLFVTVATINAVNMLDGVDGLAASVCLVQFTTTLILAMLGGQFTVSIILLLLIFSLLGFWLLNFPILQRKKVQCFMGDSGSMFLGFATAWFMIQLSQGSSKVFEPVIILWILAVPLIDMATVAFRRLVAGRSPFLAAMDHTHHLLLGYGFNQLKCTLILTSISILFGVIGIAASILHIPDHLMFFALMSVFVLHWLLSNYFWANLGKIQQQTGLSN